MKNIPRQKIHAAILYLLLFCLSLGSDILAVDLGPFSLYPLRLLLITASLWYVFLNVREKKIPFTGTDTRFLAVPLLMLLYGGISLFLVSKPFEAVKELTNVALGGAFLWVLKEAAIRSEKPFEKIWTGLAWGTAFTLIVAFLEVITRTHLPSPYSQKLQLYYDIHFVQLSPASTFGNPNHFGMFLSLGAFVWVYSMLKGYRRNVSGILFLLSFLVLWLTLSKFNILIFIALQLLLLFFFRETIYQFFRPNKLKLAAVLISILGMAFVYYSKKNQVVQVRMENVENLELKAGSGSGSVRYTLMIEGLEFARKSNYLGIGPGQFAHYMKKYRKVKYTNGILSPHFGGIEIFTQYGIILLLAWLGWGVWLLVRILKNIRREPSLWVMLLMLGSLPIIMMVNSSFLNSPVAWAYLAILNWLSGFILNGHEPETTHI